jgi:hypothetical protein
MANGLFPSFVKLFYHSAYAPHVQTIPTKQWYPGIAGLGFFNNWFELPVDASDMIDAFVAKEKVVMPPGTTFDYWEIWNYPDPDSLPQPVQTGTLGVVGTSAGTGWSKAVEQTFLMRTTGFGLAKLVLLDVPTDNFFGKVAAADFTTPYNDLVNIFMDENWAWSGRDNNRASIVKQATITLNEKLRRSYKLT